MRIAVIGAKGLPAKQGGVEHHCKEIYSRMVEQGHTVDLFARSTYTSGLSPYMYQGIRVIPLPCLKLRGIDALVSSALGAIAASGTRYDIIHFHAMGPAFFSWLPRFTASGQVVVTCHGLDWTRAKWGRFSTYFLRRGEKTAVQSAKALIVVSEELQTYFRYLYARDTIYIPNAPAGYLSSNPEFPFVKGLDLQPKRYVVFLGRLVPEKRPELLLQAFQALRPEGWKLVFIGGTSDTNRFMTQLMAEAQEDSAVLFTGELWGERLAEVVRGSGLFVLPSDVEGLSLALLEAMHEGIPSIASNIPIHAQLLAEQRGVLFEAGNLESCISCLSWAITHPYRMQAMAEKAQRYIKTYYDWGRITAQTLEVYKQVCANTLPQVQSAPLPSASLPALPQRVLQK